MYTCNNITNTTNAVIHNNIKKIHEKLTDCILKQSISVNKVDKQDNNANSAINTSKKAHEKLFKNVIKQIISCNNTLIDDECNKLHKKLFNKVIKELALANKSHKQNNSGYKHSSAIVKDNTINELSMHYTQIKINNKVYIQIKSLNRVHIYDILKCKHDFQYEIDNTHDNLLLSYDNKALNIENILLNNFKKIKKIEKGLIECNKNIISSIRKIYTDDKTKLCELKKTNTKIDMLLDYFCLLVYSKKRAKDAIIENVKTRENIKNYIKTIENKSICLFKIEKYLLYDVLDDIYIELKNKKYHEVLCEC